MVVYSYFQHPIQSFHLFGFILIFLEYQDIEFNQYSHVTFEMGKCKDGRIFCLHIRQQDKSTLSYASPSPPPTPLYMEVLVHQDA